MRSKRLLTVLSCISFILLAGFLPAKVFCADPIVLNWASMLPRTNTEAIAFQKLFADKVNEKAKGQLVINYRGGPDVIGQFDLGSAVQKGIIEIAMVSVGFYEALVPGNGAAMLSEITPQEERKPGGAFSYLDEMHGKAGMKYLGRAAPSKDKFFFVFTRKKVTTQKDFQGFRIGCSTGSRSAVEGWGATVTNVKISDYYNAMERGLVDAIAGVPLDVWVSLGAHEVTKYVIDHPYYVSTAVAIMNLSSWKKLPQNLQDLITDAMVEFEKEKVVLEQKSREEARQKMISSKIEFYKLDSQVADWFVKTAYSAAWDYQQKRFPDVTPRLKELLTRK
jgi:TRAP-type C4-dicarboxylate transport system substrate-binding protein